MSDIKKVVLAYSGGLDTSVILKWLQDTYQCEVVTFTADLGQGEELEPARAKALQFGIKPEQIYIEDLREEFVRDFVFPMFRANTVYEGEYLLGTSIARPLIAKRLIEIVNATGADAICHGATGKGNDQVRFELGAYALKPDIKVIAPWREWDLLSREKLLAYAETHGIPVDMKHKAGGPFEAGTPRPAQPPAGAVYVDQELLALLNAQVGDAVQIGEATFRIAGVVAEEPGQLGGVFGFAPRVFLRADEIEATRVLQPGSRLTYLYQFAGKPDPLAAFSAALKPRLDSTQRLIGSREGVETSTS